MSMVDGTGLVVWEGGLFDPAGDLLPRVRWVFTRMRAEGWVITLNEAGRPYGVESDKYARNSADTLSGRSTVWYQWGRYLRGETPSAANPANGPLASNHTRGLSVDTNTNNMARRRELFAQVGMDFDIPSESWHCTIYRNPTVDLSAFASGNITPIVEDDMFSDDDRAKLDQIQADLTKAISNADDAGLMQVYYVDGGAAIAIDTTNSQAPIIFRNGEELQHLRDLKRVTRDAVQLGQVELDIQLKDAQRKYEAKYPKA